MDKCFICENCLGNTFSLYINKDDKKYHTCSYNCNLKVEEKLGEDYWEFVVNKSDFINPFNKNPFSNPFIIDFNVKKDDKSIFDTNLFDFNDDEQFIDPERYESQYEIYLENKRIDEIFNESDNSSNISYDSDY